MRVGLIVYQCGETYYCTHQVGEIPAVSPSTTLIFSMDEDVSTPRELFLKAREEADLRGIGKVVNLPG